METLILWLVLAADRGAFTHCFYSETRPTVEEPMPAVSYIRAVPIGEADKMCPVKILQTIHALPEDAA